MQNHLSCDDSVGNPSGSCCCGVCVGSENSVMNGTFGWMAVYRAAELALISVMRRSGGFDSSKRAGIRCPRGLIVIVYSAKGECDVAGDALKVEDATWDVEVMKASELVMVDFWAVWCGPCQMVAPIIEELGKEYAGKVKVRKLNTDENPEVAGRYQVMSIPTILFFKNGQVVEKLVGARPKRQFKEMIDSLLAQPAGSA